MSTEKDMPKPTTWMQGLDYRLAKLRATMIEKHIAYGTGNILQGGVKGLRSRIGDKIARLDEHLAAEKKRESVMNVHKWFPDHFTAIDMQGCLRKLPSIEDTDEPLDEILIDTPNYFIIYGMLEDGTWELPFDPGE